MIQVDPECRSLEGFMRTKSDALLFCLSAAVSALAGKRFLSCLWELTYRCNARCSICGYWNHPSDPSAELRLAEIKVGLNRIYEYGCRLVNFTGGEPTLRPDLEEIVAYASGMRIWTSVVTNGSLLTCNRIRALRDAGLDNLLVSLDSTAPLIHDAQRGIAGSYAKVVQCVQWIQSEFLRGHRTGGIMCVLSSQNIAGLDEIVQFADRNGIFVLFQPYHINKTGDPNPVVQPNDTGVGRLRRLKSRSRSVLNSRSYCRGLERFLIGRHRTPCHAGVKYFSVDPFGNLHPCVDMPAAGNLLRDDIKVVRTQEALAEVRSCRGCWYCFRGEADTSLSLAGCLEKILLAASVLRHNIKAGGRADNASDRDHSSSTADTHSDFSTRLD
jgi:AdoMet-dependent heme synthase